MGWNSWNKFGCDIDEQLIRDIADAMVSTGMRDAGYIYLNIDDCWMASQRDANGRLQVNSERFPSGMKALADYVHSKGLKIGIYSSAGTMTCQRLPASLDHEEQDAKSFASWGIDYLKYDNCYNQGRDAVERYTKMKEALAATGRPIVFSICEWGSNRPWLWAPEIGNLWRTTGDIRDDWDRMMYILDQQVGLAKYAHPGAWNDPDMLEVGNGGMTTTEYQTHFSMWCMLAAPLLAGNDLRAMSNETKSILLNKEVIAIDQDPAGIQGYKVRDDGDQEVWVKPLANGDRAVALLNRGMTRVFMSVEAADVGLPKADRYQVRDLWHQGRQGFGGRMPQREQVTGGRIDAGVAPHGVALYRVHPITE